MTPQQTAEKAKAIDVEERQASLPAVRNGGDVALLPTEDEWADVDSGDLTDEVGRIPLLALNRKLDGGFTLPDTGEITQQIDFVWLARSKSRAWWPEAFGKGDAAPGCRSFDGQVPDPNSPQLQNNGDACATCPHSQWNGDEAPDCHESIEAFVALVDNTDQALRLARIRFGGLALAPARAFWQSFQTRMPRKPSIAFVVSCTLEPKDTDNGKFLVPSFARVHELSRAEAQPLIDERNRYLEEWKTNVAADVTEGRSGSSDDGPGPFDEPSQPPAQRDQADKRSDEQPAYGDEPDF